DVFTSLKSSAASTAASAASVRGSLPTGFTPGATPAPVPVPAPAPAAGAIPAANPAAAASQQVEIQMKVPVGVKASLSVDSSSDAAAAATRAPISGTVPAADAQPVADFKDAIHGTSLPGSSVQTAASTTLDQGMWEVAGGMAKAAKGGAFFGALISLVINGVEILTGKEGVGQGIGNIAADSADGAVASAVGAAASGLAVAGLATVGLTVGLPVTIAGIAAGLLGAWIGNKFFKGTGIYNAVQGLVTNLVGG
ncbi:MAG: hypothetical protein KGR26_06040, partial [Cyanobacteria bacterium REEB65]|nr:hypothetical protein [Cyanobacteria bacterium REEB65]